MDYKIISDSSCDLTKEYEKKLDIDFVPFKIDVEDKTFVDDDDLDVQYFIQEMVKSKEAIKTSCPSPNEYLEAMKKYAHLKGIFLLTISSKLSGSYNAAMTAVNIFKSENPDTKVHIFDTKSASAGQTNIAIKIKEIIDTGIDFDEIVKKGEAFIDELHTFFLLESLDNLLKNGRIKKTTGLIANMLNIKPVMRAVDGEIELYEMNRGFKKALSKMAETVEKFGGNVEEKRLTISHVNALEKAKLLEEKIREKYNFKEIIITPTKGLASGYAYDGGIVIGY